MIGSGKVAEMSQIADRGNAAGRATREAIVLAAERLFADQGVDAVSLREIARAAGQGNIAAVQFHFGDKVGLIQAIYLYRLPLTDSRRQTILDEIVASGNVTIHALMEALVRPVAEYIADPGNFYISFQARLIATGTEFGHSLRGQPDATAMLELQGQLRACLPSCPPNVVDRRFAMVIEWMVVSLAEYERSVAAGSKVMPLETAIEDLVELFSCAMSARPV